MSRHFRTAAQYAERSLIVPAIACLPLSSAFVARLEQLTVIAAIAICTAQRRSDQHANGNRRAVLAARSAA
jgi:hypothetical protein